MEFCSLLESYGHVVYENKKSFEKKLSEKYFFEWWKISVENFWHFFWKSIFFENVGFSDFFLKIWIFRNFKFFIDRKIFFKKKFWTFFFVFINYMNTAFQYTIRINLTPFGCREWAIWSLRKSGNPRNWSFSRYTVISSDWAETCM